jgi:hypothetical protein
MPTRVPFVRRAYDGSQSSARLSDLMRYRGSRQADAIREQGNISAQMWSGIGNNIANATGQIAQHLGNADETKLKKLRAERELKFEQLLNESDGMDPTDFIAKLRSIDPDKAVAMEKAQRTQLKEGVDLQVSQYTLAGKKIEAASSLLASLETVPEADRPAAYQSIAPKIRELVGPELGARVPPDYDPAFVETATQWGMSTTEKLRLRTEAFTRLTTETKNAAEADKNARDFLVKFLPSADTPEEWAEAIKTAKASGAKPETIAVFGEQFSPEALERVSQVAVGPQKSERGDFNEYLDTYAREKGQPRASLTTRQIEDARQRYGNADNDPTLRAVRELTLQSAQTKAGTLPPAQQRRVNALADQFKADPAVKRATVIGEAVNFVQSLDPNSQSPADDQALIYAFAKAMDPESVVREGEYATVQKYAQSWVQNMGFNAARVLSNSEFLSESARKNMKATIQQKFDASRKSYDNARTEYAKQIDRVTGTNDGVEHLIDYAGAFPKATNPPPPPQSTAPAAPKAPPKVNDIVMWNGKRQRVKAIVNGELILVDPQ